MNVGDKIRMMNNAEIARFLINFNNTFGEEYEGEASCEDWLNEKYDGQFDTN